jgi:cytochrome c-type protein NapC
MSALDIVAALFAAFVAVLAVVVGVNADSIRGRAGRILAFLALFILPAASLYAGYSSHMEKAQSTEFCLSCHVMSDYGKSLHVDDPSYIPAAHFQNNRIPRDRACYTCHTDYTMFGGVHSKLRGVRHLYVEYLGTIPAPDKIRLYEPYNNRECLHCHNGARKFEEATAHHRTPELMEAIKSNARSCTASKCHDTVHDVDTLADATFWKGATK